MARELIGQSEADLEEQGTGGTVFAGLTHVLQSPYLMGICLFVAIGKFAATFVYNNLQVVLKQQVTDYLERAALFSQMNLFAQSGSLLVQAVLAGWMMKRFGVGIALVVPCGLMFLLFVWLGVEAVLTTLVIAQVAQQVLAYGLLVPAQHVLFTVVSREDKYKSKAFTDTVVFRGSDVAAGKACDWMIGSGTTLAVLSLAMLPLVFSWGALALWLGREYRRKSHA